MKAYLEPAAQRWTKRWYIPKHAERLMGLLKDAHFTAAEFPDYIQ